MRMSRVLLARTLAPNSSSRATSPSKKAGSTPRACTRTPSVNTLTSKVSGTARMFPLASVPVSSSVARSTASPKKKRRPSPSSTRNCSTASPPKSSSTWWRARTPGARPSWSSPTPVTRRSRSTAIPRSRFATQSLISNRKWGKPHFLFSIKRLLHSHRECGFDRILFFLFRETKTVPFCRRN